MTARFSRKKKLAFAGIAIVALLLSLEGAFRLVYAFAGAKRPRLEHAAAFFLGERVGTFEPWPYVGYRLAPGDDPRVRDEGFFSTRPIAKPRTEGVLRLAFVGGSTTLVASDSGTDGSFPGIVEAMARRAGVAIEVMNCGVPGWTSAENLVHYALAIQDYRPDWVIVHQGANDVAARLYRKFRPDYGHFRRPFELRRPGAIEAFFVRHSRLYTWVLLRTRGIPSDVSEVATRPLPPASEQRLSPEGVETFRRNTETLVNVAIASGARVLLTTESHARRPRAGEEVQTAMRTAMDQFNDVVREIATRRDLPLADTEAALDGRGDLFGDYVHVTKAGNRIKARVVARALRHGDAALAARPASGVRPR
jgi:lysophospholipase L1-like esterase